MICLQTSLLAFSQTDTDSLVCVPVEHLRKAAVELIEYDFCKIERDSLRLTIGDLSQIISNKDSIIQYETKLKETSFETIDSLGYIISTLNVEAEVLKEENQKITKKRNIYRKITGALGTVIVILLKL